MTEPPLVDELDPVPDPAVACERMAGLPGRVLLDSARHDERLGRYSFLCADPAAVVRAKGAIVERADGAGRTDRGAGSFGHGYAPVAGDAIAAVRALLPTEWATPVPGLPPFQGGAAGYLAYDWGAQLERLPAPRYDDLAIPDAIMGLYDWVVAWDHELGRAWLISTGLPETGARARQRATERRDMVAARLAGTAASRSAASRSAACRSAASRSAASRSAASRSAAPAPSYPVDAFEGARVLGLRSSFARAAYIAAVARVVEYIRAGDIFQANLSQRFEAPLRTSPWALYRRLRTGNPAPFAAFLDLDDVVVLSASPERFLAVDTAGAVETRPIKGTRPRGHGPEHDALLGRALTESTKDRAENLMIVDLLRNDLSRVCRPGTVRVPELFTLEHHATVHHLVSAVVGLLEPGADAGDLLRATFPGGSITGAPKVRAMEIIAELEPSRRGVYCGAIGYWSATGALDTSIVIRTYVALRNRVYFSAGGGIVADSDPESEYVETLDKARALVAALRGAED